MYHVARHKGAVTSFVASWPRWHLWLSLGLARQAPHELVYPFIRGGQEDSNVGANGGLGVTDVTNGQVEQ